MKTIMPNRYTYVNIVKHCCKLFKGNNETCVIIYPLLTLSLRVDFSHVKYVLYF